MAETVRYQPTSEDLFEIITRGDSLTVILDGKTVNDYDKFVISLEEAHDDYFVRTTKTQEIGFITVNDNNDIDPLTVCVFENGKNGSIFATFRQGKAVWSKWMAQSKRWSVKKSSGIRHPYYRFRVFIPNTDEACPGEYLHTVITYNRCLVSKVSTIGKKGRVKRLIGLAGMDVDRHGGYRKYVYRLYRIQEGRCAICGGFMAPEWSNIHVDHIRPVFLGGTDDIENLRATHDRCNLGRTADDYAKTVDGSHGEQNVSS